MVEAGLDLEGCLPASAHNNIKKTASKPLHTFVYRIPVIKYPDQAKVQPKNTEAAHR